MCEPGASPTPLPLTRGLGDLASRDGSRVRVGRTSPSLIVSLRAQTAGREQS